MTRQQKKTTGEKCYDSLRRLLTYEQLKPGSRLSELEWVKRLGIHRTAVREAMAMLSHEGLLERGSKGGFFVPVRSHQDIQEIWQARSVIESSVIQIIIEKIRAGELSAESFKLLEDLCNLMEELLKVKAGLAVSEIDRQFHRELTALTGNSRLLKIFDFTATPFFSSWLQLDLDTQTKIHCISLEEHRKLISCLKKANLKDSQELSRKHISDRIHLFSNETPTTDGKGKNKPQNDTTKKMKNRF